MPYYCWYVSLSIYKLQSHSHFYLPYQDHNQLIQSLWFSFTYSFIVLGTVGCFYILSNFIRLILGGEGSKLTLSQLIDQHAIEYGWMLKLLANCFGYLCVFVPGILIYHYTKNTKYLERNGKYIPLCSGLAGASILETLDNSIRNWKFSITDRGYIPSIIKSCFSGLELDRIDTNTMTKLISSTAIKDCVLISFCFVGLMGSYLTWGLLQEKIITQQYTNSDDKSSYFKDSQFLVFVNRGLALIIAAIYLLFRPQCRHRAPFYKYSFASFSNIMSAWFQYEALKFVNFPTQVLAKSCKIIPVMMMGKVISRAKYEFYEYFTAILISFGMVMFLMGSADGSHASSITTMTGVLMLTLYMLFDSFTSNWQGSLFKAYSVSPVQMMCGVNLFSTLFTAASLSMQGGFMDSLDFAIEVMYKCWNVRTHGAFVWCRSIHIFNCTPFRFSIPSSLLIAWFCR